MVTEKSAPRSVLKHLINSEQQWKPEKAPGIKNGTRDVLQCINNEELVYRLQNFKMYKMWISWHNAAV